MMNFNPPFADAITDFADFNSTLKLPDDNNNTPPQVTSIVDNFMNCLDPHLSMKKGMWFPCGKCILCIKKDANSWFIRICHEMEYHKDNAFLTLTYATKNLPPDSELNPKELSDFMKRLRKPISPKKIRYFAVGEYGEKKGEREKNPHYHMILFGISAPEVQDIIGKTWTYGITSVSNIKSKKGVASYVAKYVEKLATYPRKVKQHPFRLMSLKGEDGGAGGIGYQWIRDHKEEFRQNNGKITLDGKELYGPSYYFKKAYTEEERRERRNEKTMEAIEKVSEEIRARGVSFSVLYKEHLERCQKKAQNCVKRFSNKKSSELHYISPTNRIVEQFLDTKLSNTEFVPEGNISMKFLENLLPNMTPIKHPEIPTNLSPP
jgi:hypothetical protein